MKKIFLSVCAIVAIAAMSSCNKGPAAMPAEEISKKVDAAFAEKSKTLTEEATKACIMNMDAAVKAKADQLLQAAAAPAPVTK